MLTLAGRPKAEKGNVTTSLGQTGIEDTPCFWLNQMSLEKKNVALPEADWRSTRKLIRSLRKRLQMRERVW